jgi:hypothetical protein
MVLSWIRYTHAPREAKDFALRFGFLEALCDDCVISAIREKPRRYVTSVRVARRLLREPILAILEESIHFASVLRAYIKASIIHGDSFMKLLPWSIKKWFFYLLDPEEHKRTITRNPQLIGDFIALPEWRIQEAAWALHYALRYGWPGLIDVARQAHESSLRKIEPPKTIHSSITPETLSEVCNIISFVEDDLWPRGLCSLCWADFMMLNHDCTCHPCGILNPDSRMFGIRLTKGSGGIVHDSRMFGIRLTKEPWMQDLHALESRGEFTPEQIEELKSLLRTILRLAL